MHSNAENAAATWTGLKNLVSVQVVQNGGLVIFFDSEVNSVCTKASTKSVYIMSGYQSVTIDGVKSFLFTSLTALSTGIQVTVLYDDTTSHCWGKYLEIFK